MSRLRNKGAWCSHRVLHSLSQGSLTNSNRLFHLIPLSIAVALASTSCLSLAIQGIPGYQGFLQCLVISFIHHLRDFGHCRGFLVQSRSPGFFTCGVNNLLHFTSDSLRPSVSSSASHDFKPLCLALTSVVDRLWWCLQRRKSNPASGSTVGGDIELFISHNRLPPLSSLVALRV